MRSTRRKRILEAKKRVLIWASLENVPDDKLDVLAVENRVLFYNSGLDPSIKRQLIQNSIYWYTKLGTRQAMEEMIDIVFQNDNSSVEEWYIRRRSLPFPDRGRNKCFTDFDHGIFKILKHC